MTQSFSQHIMPYGGGITPRIERASGAELARLRALGMLAATRLEDVHGQPGTAETCTPGLNRDVMPENLLGDNVSALSYISDKARLHSGVRSAPGELLVKRLDFNSVGSIGQVRAQHELTYAIGEMDPAQYPMIADSPTSYIAGAAPAAAFAGPNVVTGFVINWGVSMLQWAPFIIHITTANAFSAFVRTVCDRDISVYADGRTNGNSIYALFAHRLNNAMSIAQAQVVQVPDAGPPAPPRLTVRVIDLPVALAPFFSATVELLTAFSPVTAAHATMNGLYDGLVRRS